MMPALEFHLCDEPELLGIVKARTVIRAEVGVARLQGEPLVDRPGCDQVNFGAEVVAGIFGGKVMLEGAKLHSAERPG